MKSQNVEPVVEAGVMGRYHSIDVMRALALIIMVPCHFVLLYSSQVAYAHETLYLLASDVIGGLSAPLFLFLVGTSQVISFQAKPQSLKLMDEVGVRMVRRACAIFFMAVLLAMSLESTVYEWGILPLIAASLITLCFIRRLPTSVLLAIGLAIFFASPLLRGWLGYLSYWTPEISPDEFSQWTGAWLVDPLNEYVNGRDLRLPRIIAGFFVTGYFPFFPWVAFPILGFAAGKVHYSKTETSKVIQFVSPLLAVALMAIGGALVRLAYLNGTPNLESGFVAPLSFFPLTPTWMLIQLGFCLLLMNLFRRTVDKVQRPEASLTFCRFLSKYSLTVYWLHYLVAYWPPRIAEMLTGDEVAYMGRLLDVPSAILLSFLTLLVLYFVFLVWEKFDGRFSCGWFVNQLAMTKKSPILTVRGSTEIEVCGNTQTHEAQTS